jgi:GT2 family glycosyltransferase
MKNNHIKLSIIIISYNVKNKLLKCLRQIVGEKEWEVVVIDNDSCDKTAESINIRFSNLIKIVKNENNLGFARAVNIGIARATGENILLLNPDTIASKKSIKTLLDYLNNSNDRVGLVAGLMKNPRSNKLINSFFNKINFKIAISEFTNLKKVINKFKIRTGFYYQKSTNNKPLQVFGLSGGYLMFKKKIIDKVGYFDEHFFLYLEDVDFSYRVNNIGYKNYLIPNADIIHDEGSSSSTSKYRINIVAWRKSRNYLFKKYFNKYENIIMQLIFIIDDKLIDFKHILLAEPIK